MVSSAGSTRGERLSRDIPVDQQVEVCSLLGDIGLASGKPQVSHSWRGRVPPLARPAAGHLLEGYVGPTLELFLTTWPEPLIKVHHDDTDLSLFDLHAHA